jgi:hypothetical protein
LVARQHLTLETIQTWSRATLEEHWRRTFGQAPPPYSQMAFMRQALAWQLQAGSLGTGPAKLPSLSEGDGRRAAVALKTGTQLIREWQGRTHSVTVVPDGFEYSGKVYPSLSAVARFITGTAWSGPAFFGVRR